MLLPLKKIKTITKNLLQSRFRQYLILYVSIVLLFTVFLVYKIGDVPGLFFDETNYAAEVNSFAKFGTDIHGLHYPVYLTSIWGQGQSILYTIFAVPLVKIFGFSIFSFRLPMAIIGIVCITLITIATRIISKNNLLSLVVLIMLVTSPWTYMSLRWVLDANIAPLILSIGIWIFVLGINQRFKSVLRLLLLIVGAIFIALSAYGYMAFWLYLPIFITLAGAVMYFKKYINSFEMLVSSIAMLAVTLPLLVFAVKIFVIHESGPTSFLFFDIPNLPGARNSSLVDLSQGHWLSVMGKNFWDGIQMYVTGSDDLPWNGLYPFGIISSLLLIFFVIGLITPAKYFKKYAFVVNIIKIQFLAFVPLMFIITPNYNHWNAINFPIILLSAYGLYIVIQTNSYFSNKIALLCFPIFLFLVFLVAYWQPNSYSQTGMINYNNIVSINKKVKGHRLFISNLEWNYVYFKMAQNVTPQYYKEHQDHANAFGLAPKFYFSNIYDISLAINKAKPGDYIYISENEDPNFYRTVNKKYLSTIKLGQSVYKLYRVI